MPRWPGHSQQLHDDAFAALAIKFGIEGALPGAEVQMAVGDGQSDFMVQQQGLQVRVGVVLPGLMMAVIGACGGEPFQPLFDVGNQATLMIVDIDGGGDVHGRDKAKAIADAAAGNDFLKLRRDVDDLLPLSGVEDQILRVRLQHSCGFRHAFYFAASRNKSGTG